VAGPVDALAQAAARTVGLPLRVAAGLAERSLDIERQLRAAAIKRGEAVAFGALDAAVSRMLKEDVIDRVLERAEATGIAQHVADRVLEDEIAEQIAERLLSGPELERMLETAFRSSLPDQLISELLASEAVWILVDEIARSPSVTEAIAHQGTGFLDQVAAKARDRSRTADARLQRIARRIGRHHSSAPGEGAELLPAPPEPGKDMP
jgi:hypothetical protein